MAEKESTYQTLVQTLGVAAMVFIQVIFFVTSPLIVLYLIIATRYWWICVLYVSWYLIFDRDADVTGRRRSEWVRSWSWWVHVRNYYPLKLVKLPWGELDKKRNYLFCFFPHGMLAVGSFLSMITNATEFQQYFPHHKSFIHSIPLFYKMPLIRELGVSLGGMQASKEALQNILCKEGGGNVSGLVVGGAQEAYFCNPGVHKIIYKKRKGFIKIALTTGAPLVPVYVFGENRLYSQATFAEDSIWHKLREFVRKNLGISVIFPVGRKEMLGFIPRKLPVTVVVGEPIEVKKTENPTQEQIDHLHQLFQTKLVDLFESQKKNYLEDHETAHLEIC